MTALVPFRPAPIHNPYWDAVKAHVEPGEFPGESPCIARLFFRMRLGRGYDKDGYTVPDHTTLPARDDYVHKFAWSVTDPWSVHFVACYSRGALLDPMAGTGYWAYLLHQLGVDVVSY